MRTYAKNLASSLATRVASYEDPENIYRAEEIPGLAEVYVDNAYIEFDVPYKKYRPYLVLSGYVGKLKGDFPYGFDTLEFQEGSAPKVTYTYEFLNDELGELVSKGLYQEDFEVPEELFSGPIELPCKVDVMSFTPEHEDDVPVIFAGVEDAYRLITNNKESAYDLHSYFRNFTRYEEELDHTSPQDYIEHDANFTAIDYEGKLLPKPEDEYEDTEQLQEDMDQLGLMLSSELGGKEDVIEMYRNISERMNAILEERLSGKNVSQSEEEITPLFEEDSEEEYAEPETEIKTSDEVTENSPDVPEDPAVVTQEPAVPEVSSDRDLDIFEDFEPFADFDDESEEPEESETEDDFGFDDDGYVDLESREGISEDISYDDTKQNEKDY